MAAGLRHLALRVRSVEAASAFYREHFGMRVVWQPDAESVYLSSGGDNLALHAAPDLPAPGTRGALDHLGFVVDSADDVHQRADTMRARGVPIVRPPRTHRDGSVSFYCHDPDENVVQVLWIPPDLR
jgi:catechol 2,3-dioxygenase-like lactoylglutathione lyase family enzyme